MTSERNYTPIFRGQFDGDSHARWSAIHAFLRAWLGIDIPNGVRANDHTENSASIRYWDQLVEFSACGEPQIRDCPIWTSLDSYMDHSDIPDATVFLEQGEGDRFWTVRDDLLLEDDPPVDVYSLNYDSAHDAYDGRINSFSEFAFRYLCLYNMISSRSLRTFSANLNASQLDASYEWFDFVLHLSSTEGVVPVLLESTDIAAIPIGNQLVVSIFRDASDLGMPSFLRRAYNRE